MYEAVRFSFVTPIGHPPMENVYSILTPHEESDAAEFETCSKEEEEEFEYSQCRCEFCKLSTRRTMSLLWELISMVEKAIKKSILVM